MGVISQQIYKKMSSLPEEHMRKMAELYGQLNRDYCAGTPIDVKEIDVYKRQGLTSTYWVTSSFNCLYIFIPP